MSKEHSMNLTPVIAFEQVGFRYPEGGVLFSAFSMTLHEGGFHLIKGPSGAGKSTLLRLMNRLEEPTEGTLLLKGAPYSAYPVQELRRRILYIQQTPVVTDGTVKENLLLPFSFRNNRNLPLPDDNRLSAFLNEFSLENVTLDRQARSLSVGQQQRLCLIRGLLLSPEVILLDEPTSALDDESSAIVDRMTESICIDHGKTVVMVSHREFNPERVQPVIITVEGGRISARTELPHGS
jgi:putative ABC transport system ATP-binding protein